MFTMCLPYAKKRLLGVERSTGNPPGTGPARYEHIPGRAREAMVGKSTMRR